MSTQVRTSESWLPDGFTAQDLRNAMGMLLAKVRDLEKRLEENKPFDEFNRYDMEIDGLRKWANDANQELLKIPYLENQVKILTAQNARLQDEMRESRKGA